MIQEDIHGQEGGGPPSSARSARSVRSKIIVAVVIAVIGTGASLLSCVGQSFSLRQARALEGIEHRLDQIQQRCSLDHPAAVEMPR